MGGTKGGSVLSELGRRGPLAETRMVKIEDVLSLETEKSYGHCQWHCFKQRRRQRNALAFPFSYQSFPLVKPGRKPIGK